MLRGYWNIINTNSTMTTNNPIKFESIDYLIVGSGILFLVISWVYAGIEYSSLPDTIASHFNHRGEADGYSDKSTLWFICGIFTLLTVGIFFLAKATHLHNIQLKTRLANFRSIAILIPFIGTIQGIAVITIVQTSKGSYTFSDWILPLILGLTGIYLVFMITIIVKNKKS